MRIVTLNPWSSARASWTVDRDTTLCAVFVGCPALLSVDPTIGQTTWSKPSVDFVREEMVMELGLADVVNGVFYPGMISGIRVPLSSGTQLHLSVDNSFGTGLVQLYLEDET